MLVQMCESATTAIIDEETDEYVLNGTKCFISGGGQAESLIIFALTDPSKGIKGMSAIIVDKGTPGFSIGKIEEKWVFMVQKLQS